jgi:hypothetical protein
MTMTWLEFLAFVNLGLKELIETDFASVRFGNIGMAFQLASILGLVLLVTLTRFIISNRRHSRFHSGHANDISHQKPLWVWFVHNLPKALVAGAVVLILIAVADPFLTATEEVTGYVDSRVRVDLVDTSGSMGWEFPGLGQSRAEVAREAHLRFLEMRREKNDRVSLWLFSTYPYMMDDFVVDDELYYFQVFDAPYVTAQRIDRSMIVPRDKVRIIPGEGDTNIVRPLQAIIHQFDRDEAAMGGGQNLNRAVLIITDAAVNEFPYEEFTALSQRNIIPYIIYINTGVRGAMIGLPGGTPQLIDLIENFGGDYFDVTNRDGLTRAYEAIDEREAVRVELKHRALKVPIYSRFLLMAMAMLAVGVPVGFIAELFWGTNP